MNQIFILSDIILTHRIKNSTLKPLCSKKKKNLENNEMIYFLVDEPNPPPYKGVRGKAKIKIHDDIDTVVRICETNKKKYLGSLDHPVTKELVNLAKKSE
jgi:hypothetical protein